VGIAKTTLIFMKHSCIYDQPSQ